MFLTPKSMPYQCCKRGCGKLRRLSRLFQLYRGKGLLKEYMARPINGIVPNYVVPVRHKIVSNKIVLWGLTPNPLEFSHKSYSEHLFVAITHHLIFCENYTPILPNILILRLYLRLTAKTQYLPLKIN